jgi:trehalose-6-phosphatase
MITFKNDRTTATVDLARRAANHGAFQRAIDLLAEADGLEAWAGATPGSESRAAIVATIKHIRQVERERAAEQLAAEFGDDVSEWTV